MARSFPPANEPIAPHRVDQAGSPTQWGDYQPEITETTLPIVLWAFRDRYRDRDVRYELISNVLRGDWEEVDPSNDKVESRSPNLIQVALEDTAEAAGQVPTIRVRPRKNTDKLIDVAARMEKIGTGYFEYSRMNLLIPRTVMDLAAYGLSAWVIWPNYDDRLPAIERRDPRTCYPEPGFRPGQKVRRCIFTRKVHYAQLPADYQVKLVNFINDDTGYALEERLKLTLVEFFSETEIVVAALFSTTDMNMSMGAQMGSGFPAGQVYVPVILDRIPNELGVCPVVIGSRITYDDEFRGQFDQVIGIQTAHVRLMSLVLDYADQAVYSDVWVKDLIGEMAWGGGGYIELGPQGAIGRVPPAVSSLNIQQDLANLVDSIHLGARWPKQRPGEVDQAIASAKFLEATAGVMNTAIKTYHQILEIMQEQALRLCFISDLHYFPGEKQIDGVLRNQQFVLSYDPRKHIDPNNRILVEYGLGLGRDPAQSAVLMIQYAEKGYISKEFVQENIEGLQDVERERIRIDVEQVQDMMRAFLLQKIQSGEISPS